MDVVKLWEKVKKTMKRKISEGEFELFFENVKGFTMEFKDNKAKGNRYSQIVTEKLKKEVEELEKIRIKECNDLENITDQMCGIRYRESKSIDFNGETFFIKDIAKYLRENPKIAGKIPGKISELVPCPITNDEFSFLKTKYRQQVSENEEKEIVSGLNNISDYLDVSEFEELVNDKKRTWKELEKLLNDNSFNIDSNILYVNGKEIIDLKKFKENYDVKQTIPKELTEDMEKWKVDVAISGGTDNGNKINWQNFIEDIKELHEYLNNLRPKLFKKRIDFSGIALSDAVKMIQELKNAFNNPGLMFNLNVKKAKNRIGSRITLNEKKKKKKKKKKN